MGIRIVAISKRSVDVRIVRVSLNLDNAVVKDRLAGNIQDIISYDETQRFYKYNVGRSEFLSRYILSSKR